MTPTLSGLVRLLPTISCIHVCLCFHTALLNVMPVVTCASFLGVDHIRPARSKHRCPGLEGVGRFGRKTSVIRGTAMIFMEKRLMGTVACQTCPRLCAQRLVQDVQSVGTEGQQSPAGGLERFWLVMPREAACHLAQGLGSETWSLNDPAISRTRLTSGACFMI